MEHMIGAALIVFVVFVAPIWVIAHYVTRWRTAKTLSAEDERVFAELWNGLERMEGRIANIERILDAETPEWRRQQR